MKRKTIVLLLASAGVLLGSVLSAAAQTASKTQSGPRTEAYPPISPPSEEWRERAMRSRAQAPEAAPAQGRLQDPEGRVERPGSAEGSGDLGKERGGKDRDQE